MTDKNQEKQFYEIADKYIDLANELAKSEGFANTGTALRYAAARYNVFEASMSIKDLSKEQDKIIGLLCNDFREMLKANMQDYLQRIPQH